jgi:chromosome segregation ATPase
MLTTPKKQFAPFKVPEQVETPRSQIADLRRMLKEAQRTIDDKQRDLILAAEIGQTLVEENSQLKLEYERIINSSSKECTSADKADSRYKDLELAHVDILSKYEKLSTEYGVLADTEKAHKLTIARLEQEQIRMQQDLVEHMQTIEVLDEDKKTLVREKAHLSKLTHDLQNAQTGGEGKVSELLSQVHRIEVTLESSQSDQQRLKEDMQILQTENTHANEKCAELEELMETYYSYRDTCQEQSDAILQLNGEVEFLRDANSRLQSRLNVLEPTKNSEGKDQGSKTLLGEVEDRRQELETEHQSLSEKHAGLVKGTLI